MKSPASYRSCPVYGAGEEEAAAAYDSTITAWKPWKAVSDSDRDHNSRIRHKHRNLPTANLRASSHSSLDNATKTMKTSCRDDTIARIWRGKVPINERTGMMAEQPRGGNNGAKA